MKLSRFEKTAIAIYLLILIAVFIVMPLASPRTSSAFFSWPAGSVWSNLLASAILGGPAILAVFRQMERHHREHVRRMRQHHAAQMDAIERLTAHVTGRV